MSPDAPARGVVADPALNARYRDLLRQSLPPSLAPMIPFFCDLTRLHTLAAMLDRWLDAGPNGRAEQVLNVGCGPLASELFVAALRGRRIASFDYTPAFVAAGERLQAAGLLPGVEIAQGDAMTATFAPARFDAVILHDVLYERALDLGELLPRYRRFLAPGGLLYLDFMNLRVRWLWRLLGREKAYRRYAPADVAALLARNGFTMLERRPVRPQRGLMKHVVHGLLSVIGESNAFAVAARRDGDRAP